MPDSDDVATFIRTSFRSVWSLEMLLYLWRHPERAWTRPELVAALRASDVIVAQSADWLGAAGLVANNADGSMRYAAAAPDLDSLVVATAEYYAASPGAVRRLIISGADGGISAFADAFRLRKD